MMQRILLLTVGFLCLSWVHSRWEATDGQREPGNGSRQKTRMTGRNVNRQRRGVQKADRTSAQTQQTIKEPTSTHNNVPDRNLHTTSDLENVANRYDIGVLLEKRGYKVGVELGVQAGLFARAMLSRWASCEKYVLVDIWSHQDKNYIDTANVDNKQQSQIKRQALKQVAPWASKVVVHQNFTVDAAKYVEDNSVDFIYVDARHDYCGVMEDITAWYPKLRSGGLMAGHDYLSNADLKRIEPLSPQDWSVCENGTVNVGAVKGAVDEFAALHHLRVFSTRSTRYDGSFASWIYSPKP